MIAALILALATLPTVAEPAPSPTSPDAVIARWVRGTSQERPRVNVWLGRDEVYTRGEQARVYFKSDVDAYVTILRIDTDGRVRVLFPMDPWEDNWARGGRTFEVLGRNRDEAFRVDDYPGVGYVFAVASEDPFNYDDVVRGDHWDYRAISDGRVRGDPYVAVADLAERIAREGDYDYDIAEYNVERQYDYPRFVCYDCHTYASWRYWDPYSHYCSRFRIVIYDDWYYYPYRRYGGGTVIIRPYRPGPRYVFKDHDARNDYVTRVAERPRTPEDRRPTIERDRTSADIGGRGAIPAPVSPRRRTGTGSDAPGAAQPSEGGRRTTDRPATPGARPEPGEQPRRRPETTEGREPSGTRESSPQGEQPRRQPEPSGTREPSRTRESAPQGEEPRRRPSGNQGGGLREANPDRSEVNGTRRPSSQGRQPGNTAPDRSQRQGVRERPQQEGNRERPREAARERPRESTRSAPPAERPRAEPRSQPAPKSTGQPELKRRRPN